LELSRFLLYLPLRQFLRPHRRRKLRLYLLLHRHRKLRPHLRLHRRRKLRPQLRPVLLSPGQPFIRRIKTAEKPKTISFKIQLSAGHYTAGIDFPAGIYDIKAIAGGGNVSSSNISSGGLNTLIGTKEENKAIGIDFYEQEYANIYPVAKASSCLLSEVLIEISSDNADAGNSKKEIKRSPNPWTWQTATLSLEKTFRPACMISPPFREPGMSPQIICTMAA
jgi:hypothetical protein